LIKTQRLLSREGKAPVALLPEGATQAPLNEKYHITVARERRS